jgi:hypothetical protein
VFFALAGIVSTVVAAVNVDGSFLYPVPTAIFCGCFWSGFSFLGVWLILAYYRERLLVSSQIVRTTGCFRTREVQLPEVVRAVWKSLLKGGGLALYDRAGKVVIRFGNYGEAEQVELIEFFRDRLDEHLQEGWERFESYCVPQSPTFRQRRDRERRQALWLMPVIGAALLALSLWDP